MTWRTNRGPTVARYSGFSGRRQRDGRIVWAGVLISVGIHALALLLWPMIEVPYETRRTAMPAATMMLPMISLRQVENPFGAPPVVPAEAPVPTPQATPPPAAPPELTLDPAFVPEMPELPSLEEVLPLPPPPPPEEAPVTDEWSTYEPVTAATIQPDIRNRSEVRRFLERRYQPILSATGATGSTLLRFWIDEVGVAQRILMVASSGHERLDELALSVAEVIRFRPAVLEGEPIRVVVDVPIQFRAVMGL